MILKVYDQNSSKFIKDIKTVHYQSYGYENINIENTMIFFHRYLILIYIKCVTDVINNVSSVI